MANNPTHQEKKSRPQVAVVMVPLPVHGHLNQLLHLSRIISSYDVPVYYAATATFVCQAKLRAQGWDPNSSATNIHFHELPSTPFENPLPDPSSSTKFPSQIMPSLMASTHLRRPVYSFVDEVSRIYKRVVVIYDSLMAYVVQDLDAVRNAECYLFRSISAISVCAFEVAESGVEVLKEAPPVDGYYPPEFEEFLMLQGGAKNIFSGHIYNSNREIEGLFLDLLSKRRNAGEERIWALGPFNPVQNPRTSDSRNRHECLDFLDEQGSNSVILVSFGTTSALSDEQIMEIAVGLEGSEHKFVWIVRDADKGDIFSGEVRKLADSLPEGFEERVRERGVVVRDWAPQLEILGHPSIGGFMSHCGWNSCLESISMGVPIATWPLHSDQPANALLITRVLRVGLEVKKWCPGDELVPAITIEKVVRRLMGSEEGDEVRKRAVTLGEAVKGSLMDGGATRREIESFITRITR